MVGNTNQETKLAGDNLKKKDPKQTIKKIKVFNTMIFKTIEN